MGVRVGGGVGGEGPDLKETQGLEAGNKREVESIMGVVAFLLFSYYVSNPWLL